MSLLRGPVAAGDPGGTRRLCVYGARYTRTERGGMRKSGLKKSSLRPDTAFAPEGEPRKEIYIRELPVCCLRSFREAVIAEALEDRRRLTLDCECGESWLVTSSLDERVLNRFVTHAGSQAGGADHGPSAA